MDFPTEDARVRYLLDKHILQAESMFHEISYQFDELTKAIGSCRGPEAESYRLYYYKKIQQLPMPEKKRWLDNCRVFGEPVLSWDGSISSRTRSKK